MYQVSNHGRVRSLDRNDSIGRKIKGKMMTPSVDTGGYLQARFNKDGKGYNLSVSRLVGTLFLSNPMNFPEINHIDGNKKNNVVINLEWCTTSENIHHRYRIGLDSNCGERNPHASINEEMARVIKERVKTERIIDIVNDLRISYNIVYDIKRNRRWIHV